MNKINKLFYISHLLVSIKLSLIVISLILLFNSCGIIRHINRITEITSEKEVVFYNSKQKLVIRDKYLYIPVIKDGVKDTLLFDTGFTTEFAEISYDAPNLDSCLVIRQTTHKGKSEVIMGVAPLSIGNSLFNYKNYYKSILYIKESSCSSALPSAIIGNMVYNEKVLTLDFDNNEIGIIDNIGLVDKLGYSIIKSSFTMSATYFYVKINGKEYKLLFDTGASVSLLFPKKEYKYFTDNNDIEYYGTRFTGIDGSVGEGFVYQKETIINDFSNQKLRLNNVVFIEGQKLYVAGIDYISNYNWIMDSKNKVLYAKRRDIDDRIMDSVFTNANYRSYKTDILDDKLVVSLRKKNDGEKYPYKSIIKSVSGELITDENKCNYKDILNKSKDWDTLNIVLE